MCGFYIKSSQYAAYNSLAQRALVKGNKSLAPGTVIATFDESGRFGNHTDGRSQAAIYLGQNVHGMIVLDQWMGHGLDIKRLAKLCESA
ncbi:BPSL0067 family protein [Cronobacter condimenti]|uniref:BPSL0067 family protein n=1 Tax=Cronobacter condimenti TaxID=1163710 RepID=UPI001D0569E9|nr:BPSL0067 family protein [Cronobacter condimenti]